MWAWAWVWRECMSDGVSVRLVNECECGRECEVCVCVKCVFDCVSVRCRRRGMKCGCEV